MANSKFHHEEIYRGKEAIQKLGKTHVVVCGAGALGSNLVESLVRQGFTSICVIDMDTVEEHNLNTQTFDEADIGAKKVAAVQNRAFRAVGVDIEAVSKELTGSNIRKLLKGADLVVDMFDNMKSRQTIQDYCRSKKVPCLHAGVNGDYGEVVWDEEYRVPNANQEGDICDYPLARNLSMFIVLIASEEIVNFCVGVGGSDNAFEGQRSHSFTLKDMKISPY